MQHPFIENKKFLSLYSSAWLILILIQAVILKTFYNIGTEYAVGDALVFNLLYAILGFGLWYTVNHIASEKHKLSYILTANIINAVIIIIIWNPLSLFIINQIFTENSQYHLFLYESITWRLIIGVFYYFILTLTYYLIIYYQNLEQRINKESELKNLIKEAELRSLRYQLNPHFLYNSLNSISSLTLTDAKKAQDMTINLSNYLRRTLTKNENQLIPLKEEIKNIRLYLDIEKTRFGDRFAFEKNIAEECLEVLVPNMLLQPVIENSIKYGVYESLDKVVINLSCKYNEEFFTIEVKNNFDLEAVVNKGEGIGLKNIRDRLNIIYQRGNLLSTEINGDVFSVKIFIPLN